MCVLVPVGIVSVHQPHGSQGVPLSVHGVVGMPLPVTTPPPVIHLHRNWLTVLIHKVKLLPVPVMSGVLTFGLEIETIRILM